MRSSSLARMALMFALLSLLVVSLPLTAVAQTGNGGNRGNSANAHACGHGGWETLYREDGTGFVNQGACVSYRAQGGEFGEPAPVETRVVTLSWTFAAGSPAYDGSDLCYAFVTVSGFQPGVYQVVVTGPWSPFGLEVSSDGTGSASSYDGRYSLNNVWWNRDEAFHTATVDGVVSEASQPSCKRPY